MDYRPTMESQHFTAHLLSSVRSTGLTVASLLLRTPDGITAEWQMPADVYDICREHAAPLADRSLLFRGYIVRVPSIGTFRFITSFRSA